MKSINLELISKILIKTKEDSRTVICQFIWPRRYDESTAFAAACDVYFSLAGRQRVNLTNIFSLFAPCYVSVWLANV